MSQFNRDDLIAYFEYLDSLRESGITHTMAMLTAAE